VRREGLSHRGVIADEHADQPDRQAGFGGGGRNASSTAREQRRHHQDARATTANGRDEQVGRAEQQWVVPRGHDASHTAGGSPTRDQGVDRAAATADRRSDLVRAQRGDLRTRGGQRREETGAERFTLGRFLRTPCRGRT